MNTRNRGTKRGIVFSIFSAHCLALLSLASNAVAAELTAEFKLDTTKWDNQPVSVTLAGEMNGWNKNSPHQLTDPDGDKIWTLSIPLDEGIYLYKYVIDVGLADERWLTNPDGDKDFEQSDGFGGMNSAILVGPDVRKLPSPQPNAINPDGIAFKATDVADLNRVDADHVRVRVRTQKDDVQSVRVMAANYPTDFTLLDKLGVERGYDVWGGLVPLKLNASNGADPIRIELTDGSVSQFVTSDGNQFEVPSLTFSTPAWARDAVWYQIFPERFRNGDATNDPGDKGYERLVPWNGNWWKDQPGETPPVGPTLEEDNFYRGTGDVWNRRFGGDIAGVKEKLAYLRSLGVNAIYFNPVFEAESMHKYDTADFRHIDDNLGSHDKPRVIGMGRTITDATRPPAVVAGATSGVTPNADRDVIGNRQLFELDGTPLPADYVETNDPSTWKWTKSDLEFLAFIKEARSQGFRVIVDGVFNHTGRAHPFWKDVLEKGKNSEFADWFDVTDWGDPENWKPMRDPYKVHGKPGGIQWKAWDGPSGHLPCFRKDEKTGLAAGPYKHIMDITRRWMDPDGNPQTHDGLDGWRLDVPNDIPHPFWIAWRKVVKEEYPDAYITGEIWSPAQPWINQGDQFDAVMNYQFAMPSQQFFANQSQAMTVSQFNDRLVRLQTMYPLQAAMVMQNLFDSHDTDRASSWFVNPDRPYDGANRPQDNAKDNPYSDAAPSSEQWARFVQMSAFQMTFLGAPMIYYGNEAGMWSPDDPSNRQPFPWPDKGPYEQPGVGFNQAVFTQFQRYIAIRNLLPALRQGFYSPVVVDDVSGVLVFARTLANDGGDDRVYVVVNRSGVERVVGIPATGEAEYIDFASEASTEILQPDWLTPDARPRVKVLATAPTMRVENGQFTATVPAWGVAVIGKKP
jgi:cyclomaltodextrinase / maltogenic alpha-amylase / neopullulanase